MLQNLFQLSRKHISAWKYIILHVKHVQQVVENSCKIQNQCWIVINIVNCAEKTTVKFDRENILGVNRTPTQGDTAPQKSKMQNC